MKIEKRNLEIRKMRRSGATFVQISKKFNLSPERSRQISEEIDEKRKASFEKLKKTLQRKIYQQTSLSELWNLVAFHAISKSRKKENILEKKLLVKYLIDECSFSALEVSDLLGCHHTTVMNLYYHE